MNSDQLLRVRKIASTGIGTGSRRARWACWLPALLAVTVLASPLTQAQEIPRAQGEGPEAPRYSPDGPRYRISAIDLEYGQEHPQHPAIAELMKVEVELGETPYGYVAPRKVPVVPNVTLRLADISMLPQHWFYASAIQTISQAIVTRMNDLGYIGIYVVPSPQDTDPQSGEDLRPEGDTTLTLLINTATVGELRTVASGDRVDVTERIDNEAHRPLASDSPIRPGPGREGDLLQKNVLDRYVHFLNRHPGRRVDVAVAPGGQPGTVALDMLVTESKPWSVYFQISNTGTEATSEYRERFGFVHNQLTGNDDILSLDYITAGFDESHLLIASYEAPVGDMDRLRWRAFGSWNEYTASDVGSAGEPFEGDGWHAGGELIWNFYQDGPLFVDAVGGARFQNLSVDNNFTQESADEDFVFFYGGLQMERVTRTETTFASVTVEAMPGSLTDADATEMDTFGSLQPDEDFVTLKWDMSHSLFLEPLFNRQAWSDINTPESSTLAHELYMSFRGQYAFDYRLIPQHQRVIGGLYSVRGYEESIVAGDSAVIGTLEYRYHLPRALPMEPDPSRTPLFGEPFRWTPQQVYGRPDWDLVLRAFVDAGVVFASDPIGGVSSEDDESLAGAGVGVEFLFKRNLSIRADYGWALVRSRDGANGLREVDPGDGEFHFVATLLY